MTLSIYLIKKFSKAFGICIGVSYSIFFIFSLIGYLGENFSFESILLLSALNSFQIFAYIPSHLFILSFLLFILGLKSKNELIIIKEYIELKSLFLIIFPILIIFTLFEVEKNNFSKEIETLKSNLLSLKNLEDKKILISFKYDKKKYIILSDYNEENSNIGQYLDVEVKDQNILKGELSSNLNIEEDNLISNESTVYENNNFIKNNSKKKLFENFLSFWSENNETIIKIKADDVNTNYNNVIYILFCILFYFCISMIFLSKKLVNRNINFIKIFFLVLLIFLYSLLIPKIILDNYHYSFQIISLIIFILIFFKINQYE